MINTDYRCKNKTLGVLTAMLLLFAGCLAAFPRPAGGLILPMESTDAA